MVNWFFKIKKVISLSLILTIVFSCSPIFTNKVLAQTELINAGVSSAIMTRATITNLIPPGGLVLGTGLLFVSDLGVRHNTLESLSSSLGLNPGVAQKEGLWDSIAYFAGRILIRQITQSIVAWINSGFDGNPSFIQDPGAFLANTADITIGEFIFNSDWDFLCEPFKLNLQIALGLNYSYSSYEDRIHCRLSDVLIHTANAYENFISGDFINGGDWDSWLSIGTNPQNNSLGAMAIANLELESRILEEKNKVKDELDWNGGLLSMKQCTDGEGNTYNGDQGYKVRTDATDYKAHTCKIVTPGSWISSQAQTITNLDLERLGAADEINEIVGALANFLITKVIQTGFAGVKSEDLSPSNRNWQAGITQLQAAQTNELSEIAVSDEYDDDSSVDFRDVYKDKDVILELIKAQIRIENQYLNAQNNLNYLLDEAKGAFSSSISPSCIGTLKENIISQINGGIAPKELIWNKDDISKVIVITNHNLSELNRVRNEIIDEDMGDERAKRTVRTELYPIKTFHTPSSSKTYMLGGATFNQMRDWTSAKIIANKDICDLDLSILGNWSLSY